MTPKSFPASGWNKRAWRPLGQLCERYCSRPLLCMRMWGHVKGGREGQVSVAVLCTCKALGDAQHQQQRQQQRRNSDTHLQSDTLSSSLCSTSTCPLLLPASNVCSVRCAHSGVKQKRSSRRLMSGIWAICTATNSVQVREGGKWSRVEGRGGEGRGSRVRGRGCRGMSSRMPLHTPTPRHAPCHI